MQPIIEALKGIAQVVTLGLGALALIVLVFFPEMFATRLGMTLRALDAEDVTATLKLPVLQAELRRVTDELTEADARALAAMDAPPEASGTTRQNSVDHAVVEPQPDEWAVVAGAEDDLAAAQRIEARLEASGFDALVLQSGTWFQPTAIFLSRDAAEAALPQINALTGDTAIAYIRSLRVWCTARVSVAGEEDVFRCGA